MAKPTKIVECNCTKGFKGKIGKDIDTLRCEFGEITCTVEDFKTTPKKISTIKDVTVVKVNLENK